MIFCTPCSSVQMVLPNLHCFSALLLHINNSIPFILFLLDKAKYRYSFKYKLSLFFSLSFSPVSLSDVQSALPGSDQPQHHIDHHVIVLPSYPQWSHPLLSQLCLLSSDSSSQHSPPSPSKPQHTESQHRVSMHTKCTLWPLCFTIGSVFGSPAVCSKCLSHPHMIDTH